MRVSLIHALRHSPPPIEEAFARLWPQPHLRNLLDDGLSADLAAEGRLTPRMTERFLELTRYALSTGSDAILFTCSAFGPCIEACVREFPSTPILKPNEAMIEEATRVGGTIGLLATFAPTLASMPAEFPPTLTVRARLADGALDALNRGDASAHDRLAGEAARELAGCDVIALAQFSLARAAPAVRAATGRPVLTTPDCAVLKLRQIMTSRALNKCSDRRFKRS